MLGAGEQALAHLEAFALVHDLRRVRLWARDPDKAMAFAAAALKVCATPVEVIASVREAVMDADLICTATAAVDPILEGAWINSGAHVTLVGASVQTSAEIDTNGVKKSRYFVDYRPSAVAQAGELYRAINEGAVDLNHIVAEIGEVYDGRAAGRLSPDEITIYKSLGIAPQDLAASGAVLKATLRASPGLPRVS